MVKVKVLAKLRSPALWGSWDRGFEAHMTTTKCFEGGVSYPCIFPTYLKGLLRRNAYALLYHLERLNIIKKDAYIRLFGPSAFEEVGSTVVDEPSCIDVSFGKVVSAEEVKKIIRNWPSVRDVTPAKFEEALIIEPHIRLRDESTAVVEGSLFTEERINNDFYLYFEVGVRCPDSVSDLLKLMLFSLALLPYEPIARGSTAEICINVEGPLDELSSIIVKSINSRNTWCSQ
jgi:hypothetical protein